MNLISELEAAAASTKHHPNADALRMRVAALALQELMEKACFSCTKECKRDCLIFQIQNCEIDTLMELRGWN